jgi:MYXO-CTERM domain-containing protein
MHHTITKAVVGSCALSITSVAGAGPDWKEGFLGMADAGSLPSNAQVIFNSDFSPSPLHTISGQLGGLGVLGPGDFQDMYALQITDLIGFRATTDPSVDSNAFINFNSQLFLFDENGVPVAASDGFGPGATLTIPSIVIPSLTVGLFYLAISGFDSDPVDSSSALLFPNVTGAVVPPINFNPIADWTAGTIGGDYTIVLEHAAFVPSPGAAALLLIVGVVGTWRRRRSS